MNTINALTAITAVGSSTSDSGQRQQFQSPAQPGQILTATVLDATDSDLFSLDIGGNKIFAKSDTVSLSPGTQLELEVLSTQPEVELRIISKSPEMFFGKPLTLLSKNLTINDLFQAIQSDQPPVSTELNSLSQEVLKDFTALQQQPLPTTESGKNLQQLLDRLGPNLESVLTSGDKTQEVTQTLKTAVLELNTLLESGSELVKAANKFLGTLEQYQLTQVKLSNNTLPTASLLDPSPIFNKLSDLSQEVLRDFTALQQRPLTAKESGKNLKQLLDRLGLDLETVLAKGDKTQEASKTLKAALLELNSLLDDGSELAKTTNKFLGTLELYQLAQVKLNNDNLLIFPLPLPFLNYGYLTVDKDVSQHSTKNPKESQCFSLHLNLEPLGNIEISFLKNSDGLYIRFLCETDEKASFTSSHQEELKKYFSTDDIIGLSFGAGASDPTKSLIRRLIPEGKAILDTTA